MANVVDADAAGLHVVVEEQVEQLEQALEPVVVRARREDRIRNTARSALDGLGQTEQNEPGRERCRQIVDVQRLGEVRVDPLDEFSVFRASLE